MNRIRLAIWAYRDFADHCRAEGVKMREYGNFVIIWIFGCWLVGSFLPGAENQGGLWFGCISYLLFFGILELKDKLADWLYRPTGGDEDWSSVLGGTYSDYFDGDDYPMNGAPDL